MIKISNKNHDLNHQKIKLQIFMWTRWLFSASSLLSIFNAL